MIDWSISSVLGSNTNLSLQEILFSSSIVCFLLLDDNKFIRYCCCYTTLIELNETSVLNEFAICFLTQNILYKNIFMLHNGWKMQDNWQLCTYSHTSIGWAMDWTKQASITSSQFASSLKITCARKFYTIDEKCGTIDKCLYSHTLMLTDVLNVRLGETYNQCNQVLIALALSDM